MAKLKYHRIARVPEDVCVAEQMIAYNIAFRAHISYSDEYSALESDDAKTEAIAHMIPKMMDRYCSAYDHKPGRYNEDSIRASLEAGLKNYMDGRYKILSNYKDVGAMFPANYL